MTDIEGENHLLELMAVWVAMLLLTGAIVVWAGWIRRYVRGRGKRTANSLFNWAPVLDYLKARRIAREEHRVPWFVRVFEAMFGGALTLLILLFAWMFWRWGLLGTFWV